MQRKLSPRSPICRLRFVSLVFDLLFAIARNRCINTQANGRRAGRTDSVTDVTSADPIVSQELHSS